MPDFDIADGLVTEGTNTELFNEQLQRAVQDLERKKLELLAHAFVAGYDGVDIRVPMKTHEWKRDMQSFKVGFEHEAWEGEPPNVDRYAQGVHRYDFRGLDDWQQRELVGVRLTHQDHLLARACELAQKQSE